MAWLPVLENLALSGLQNAAADHWKRRLSRAVRRLSTVARRCYY